MDAIDCRRLGELLCDFASGDLDATLVVAVEEHLQTCPACGTHVSTYRLTVTMTRQLPPIRVPNEVMCRLREALQREGY